MILLQFFIILVLNSFAAEEQPKQVLLTYFKPFGGDVKNNSKDVALKTAQKLRMQGYVVNLCELDVIYGKSYQESLDCAKKNPHQLIISLGQGGNCKSTIELVGLNIKSSGIPDNSGQLFIEQKIMERGPSSVAISPDSIRTYCQMAKIDRKYFKASTYAGTYVCNNLLFYHLVEPHKAAYYFIHVPNHLCENKIVTEGIPAEKISKLVSTHFKKDSNVTLVAQRCIERLSKELKGVPSENNSGNYIDDNNSASEVETSTGR